MFRTMVVFVAAGLSFSCATAPARVAVDFSRSGANSLEALALDGDTLYGLASDGASLDLLAFSRSALAAAPEKVSVLGSLGLRDVKARHIAAASGRVFLAAGEKGVLVVDARDPARMTPAGSVASGTSPVRVVVASDGRLYAGSDNGLSVYNLAASPLPSFEALVPLAGAPYGLAAEGKRLYAALGRKGVAVFDLSPGSAPVPAGTIEAKGVPTGVAVKGTHLYLSDDFRGLQAADVSGTGPWRACDAFETNNFSGPLVARGDVLAAGSAAGKGVLVFSTTDPERPELTGLVRYERTCEIRDLVLFEGGAFAAWPYDSLLVFDPAKASGAPSGFTSFDFSQKEPSRDKRVTVYLHSSLGFDEIDGKELTVKCSSDLAGGEIYRVRFAPGKHEFGMTFLDDRGEVTRRTDIEAYFEEGREYALVYDGRSVRPVALRDRP